MTGKWLEIRDRATCMPVYAFRAEPMTERGEKIQARAGWAIQGEAPVLVYVPSKHETYYAPYMAGGITLPIAIEHIIMHFDDLTEYDVVDSEYLRRERPEPRQSEWSNDGIH